MSEKRIIGASIAIMASGLLIGGWWAYRHANPPAPTDPGTMPLASLTSGAPKTGSSETRSATSVQPANDQLVKLREENERLRRENEALRTAAARSTPPVARPADPAPPKPAPRPVGVAAPRITGAAWINRKGGTSDILRGQKIALLSSHLPAARARQIYFDAAKTLTDAAAKERQQGANEGANRTSSLSTYHAEVAAEYDTSARRFQQASRDVTGATVDVMAIIKLVHGNSRGLLEPTRTVVQAATVKTVSSDVDGKFTITGFPAGNYYVHTTFDTTDGYAIWAIPAAATGGDIKLDIHNDTALVLE